MYYLISRVTLSPLAWVYAAITISLIVNACLLCSVIVMRFFTFTLIKRCNRIYAVYYICQKKNEISLSI